MEIRHCGLKTAFLTDYRFDMSLASFLTFFLSLFFVSLSLCFFFSFLLFFLFGGNWISKDIK